MMNKALTSAEDAELEHRIREELYHGCVDIAKDLVKEISDPELARDMRRVIYDYDQY